MPSPLEPVPGAAQPKPNVRKTLDTTKPSSLWRDGDDFAVLFYPGDIVVFRHTDPHAPRKMCAFLRWEIISGNSASNGEANQKGNFR